METPSSQYYLGRNLKDFLFKLGIKSAKASGIVVNFAGIRIRMPGKYSNIEVTV